MEGDGGAISHGVVLDGGELSVRSGSVARPVLLEHPLLVQANSVIDVDLENYLLLDAGLEDLLPTPR